MVALTEATSFRARVQRDDVRFVELHKGPGHGSGLLPRLTRILRELAPDVVHTRNLAALEASPAAWLARVPVRVHGEHGRDVGDLDGLSRTYRLVRRAYRPFVSHYVSVSRDLERCERVARALRAGIVWINCSQPTFTEAPWGGYKQSGIGRELGEWGLNNYLETKQITSYVSDEPWAWYIKGDA